MIGNQRDAAHPDPDRIAKALDAFLTANYPATPPTWAAKVLAECCGTPIHVRDMTITTITVTSGNPQHGAYRSDDHIGSLEVRRPKECPECPAGMATYEYRAHHHMSGSEHDECACGHVHHHEEWG